MRRAPVAILSLALVGGALLAPGAGSIAVAGESGAQCSWQRHSQRVVKHVRHHGRKRRLVRVRHWWTCEPLPATTSGPTPTPAPPPTPPGEPEPVANRVGVKSKDSGGYSYTLSRPQAEAGAITIELNNEGEDPHNLNLQLEGSGEAFHSLADTAPGKQRVATFDLPPGTYRLWCSIPTHDEQGMHATLVIE
jgi:plastocyanin